MCAMQQIYLVKTTDDLLPSHCSRVSRILEGGTEALLAVLQVLLYNRQLYKAENDQLQLPVLLPLLQYHFDIQIRCLDPEAGVDALKVLLHSKKSSVPLLSALVKMPLSELEEE